MRYLPFLLFLTSCTLPGGWIPQAGGGTAEGVAAGAGDFIAQVPGIAESAASGGWTAAILATGLAVWRASAHGLKVSRRNKVKIAAEGVKAANGGGA